MPTLHARDQIGEHGETSLQVQQVSSLNQDVTRGVGGSVRALSDFALPIRAHKYVCGLPQSPHVKVGARNMALPRSMCFSSLVEEGVPSSLAPPQKALDLAAVVSDHYGLSVASVSILGGEVDRNILVTTKDDSRYLMKMTSGSSAEDIAWQVEILQHLARTDPALPVPRLVPAQSGALAFELDQPGAPIVVRLMTWLEGRMLAEVPEPDTGLLTELGATSARLTRALSGVDPSHLPATHHWDVRRSGEAVGESLPFVTDHRRRTDVQRIMEMVDDVHPLLDGLPVAVVHQDLNDFNVLAMHVNEGHWTVSGILDFGDALHTVRVADLVVAAAYAMLRQPDPVGALCAVVAGYTALTPLTADERSVIFPLAAARLCVNATTWTRRTTQAHLPYGEDRMRHTWPAIAAIAAIAPGDAQARVMSACSTETKQDTEHREGAAHD
jgi:Ser/Thr protein kinase RdoA (MazF antagonist)